MKMNICVTVNSKYMRYLYVMLLSLYKNNRNGSIYLYVIQRDFTEDDKNVISGLTNTYQNNVEFIYADEHRFDDFKISYGNRRNLSLEIYFRLLIPELIPQSVDRVLLMDVDVIVNQSIEELYYIDLKGKCLGAAANMCHNFKVMKDWQKWYPAERMDWTHYNTGILLWDLKKIRQIYPYEYIFSKSQQIEIGTPTFEEEVFNVLFGEHDIMRVDYRKWNYIVTHEKLFAMPVFEQYETLEELRKRCAIIHYAGLNPWESGMKNAGFILWWEYAKQTPYYLKFLEEQMLRTELFVNELFMEKLLNENERVNLECTSAFARLEGKPKLKYYLDTLADHIIIWGAGYMGERLYRLFASVHMEKKIGGVVDENKNGLFHGLQIFRYEQWNKQFQGNSLFIITPVKQNRRLTFEINSYISENIRAVALMDFLKEAEDFSE